MTRRLTQATTVAAIGVLTVAAAGAPAQAARADTTPPTAPYILYSSGLKWITGCLPLTIGIQRATDNATPQSALVYDVFANGVRLGSLTDSGANAAVWGTLHFTRPGPQTVTVRAIDAAGNRSAPSNGNVVTAYPC